MKLGGVRLSLLLMRKGLQFKLFKDKFYKLTHMNALPMVHNENKGVSFVQYTRNPLIRTQLNPT